MEKAGVIEIVEKVFEGAVNILKVVLTDEEVK